MTAPNRYVFWDFDYTLAHRPGAWSQCVAEVVVRAYPDKPAVAEWFAPHLKSGFPWHTPQQARPGLASPDHWWTALYPTLQQALERGAGLSRQQAGSILDKVRAQYLAPAHWVTFEDTRPALELLTREGWGHVILSNHVPELSGLVDALGLGPHFTAVHTSAWTGHEKPHPHSYAGALNALPVAPESVVMIGDNYEADYKGAKAAGLDAVLVRRPHPDCDEYYPGLLEAARYISQRRPAALK